MIKKPINKWRLGHKPSNNHTQIIKTIQNNSHIIIIRKYQTHTVSLLSEAQNSLSSDMVRCPAAWHCCCVRTGPSFETCCIGPIWIELAEKTMESWKPTWRIFQLTNHGWHKRLKHEVLRQTCPQFRQSVVTFNWRLYGNLQTNWTVGLGCVWQENVKCGQTILVKFGCLSCSDSKKHIFFCPGFFSVGVIWLSTLVLLAPVETFLLHYANHQSCRIQMDLGTYLKHVWTNGQNIPMWPFDHYIPLLCSHESYFKVWASKAALFKRSRHENLSCSPWTLMQHLTFTVPTTAPTEHSTTTDNSEWLDGSIFKLPGLQTAVTSEEG